METTSEPLDQRVQIVASTAWLREIDGWRRRQEGLPSRSEAIRRLTGVGLKAEPLLKQLLAWMEASPAADDVRASIEDLRKMLGEKT